MSERDWSVDVDKRPAPVILAAFSGLSAFVASLFPFAQIFIITAIVLGLYSLEITIWRAAVMIADRLSPPPENGAAKGENDE